MKSIVISEDEAKALKSEDWVVNVRDIPEKDKICSSGEREIELHISRKSVSEMKEWLDERNVYFPEQVYSGDGYRYRLPIG